MSADDKVNYLSSPPASVSNPMRAQRACVQMTSSKGAQLPTGDTQMDGTPTTQFAPPQRNAPLQDRSPAPAHPRQSGMEASLGAMADSMHPPKRR